jgi:hypothetical protein
MLADLGRLGIARLLLSLRALPDRADGVLKPQRRLRAVEKTG